MKFILIPIMLLVFTSCVTEIIKVEFKMSTQMGRSVLSIDADSVIVTTNGRMAPTRFARATGDMEWENVLASLKDIKLESISTLIAPSEKRFVDAAPNSGFIITTKDSVYTSANFDGHKPNEVLVPLMEAITVIEEKNKE